MTAGQSDRRVKIRRTGRHTSPSQVEKVAQTAGKAAPAVAIAGALVVPTAQTALASTAAPVAATAETHQATVALTQAHSAPKSLATKTVTVVAAKATKHAATAKSTHYKVRPGDTLSSIAQHFYHRADAWQYLYHVNDKTLSDPDVIAAGEELYIPATAPAHYTLPNYTPKHAKTAPTVGAPESATTTSTTSSTKTLHKATTSHHSEKTRDIKKVGGGTSPVIVQTTASGDYTCSGLEQLWDNAGGNPGDAVMAAEIAMAESGGNPNAISPTDDYGLWQINASNGALATLNPQANARSAVIMSHDGTDWDPWTTYTAGLYYGKC